MNLTISKTTQSLVAALEDIQRSEVIEGRKKNGEPPVKTVAKTVAVSISADAKLEILKDTLR